MNVTQHPSWVDLSHCEHRRFICRVDDHENIYLKSQYFKLAETMRECGIQELTWGKISPLESRYNMLQALKGHTLPQRRPEFMRTMGLAIGLRVDTPDLTHEEFLLKTAKDFYNQVRAKFDPVGVTEFDTVEEIVLDADYMEEGLSIYDFNLEGQSIVYYDCEKDGDEYQIWIIRLPNGRYREATGEEIQDAEQYWDTLLFSKGIRVSHED